jgi:hypothetical protein
MGETDGGNGWEEKPDTEYPSPNLSGVVKSSRYSDLGIRVSRSIGGITS